MSAAQWLTIAGLALTLVGAFLLAYRDLRRAIAARRDGPGASMADLTFGFHRPEVWLGFPLIVIGSALQIAGTALA